MVVAVKPRVALARLDAPRRRSTPIDSRTLPLFPEAAVEAQPSAPDRTEAQPAAAKRKGNPRTGKYGGRSVPDQVFDFLRSRSPEAFAGADIAADLALPRNNVNNAIAVLRKRGVVSGAGKVAVTSAVTGAVAS